METALPLSIRAEPEYILIPDAFTLTILNRTRHQDFEQGKPPTQRPDKVKLLKHYHRRVSGKG